MQIFCVTIVLLYWTSAAFAKSGTIAFGAYANSDKVVAKANTVVSFQNVVTNEGGGYNPKTSTFKAPRAGVYYFIARVDVSSDYTAVMIALNGKPVADGNSDGNETNVVVVSVLKLKVGDVVNVRNYYAHGSVDGGKESTFIGYRIGC